MDGAHGVLLSIAGGSDLGLFEINEAASLVQEAAHPEANIIFGTVIDDSLGDEVRVTVIAAGFEAGTPTHKKLEPTAFGSAPRTANGNGASPPAQRTATATGRTATGTPRAARHARPGDRAPGRHPAARRAVVQRPAAAHAGDGRAGRPPASACRPPTAARPSRPRRCRPPAVGSSGHGVVPVVLVLAPAVGRCDGERPGRRRGRAVLHEALSVRVRRVVTDPGGRALGRSVRPVQPVGGRRRRPRRRRRQPAAAGDRAGRARGRVPDDQVHGTQVAVVDAVPRPGEPDRPGTDAAVTAAAGRRAGGADRGLRPGAARRPSGGRGGRRARRAGGSGRGRPAGDPGGHGGPGRASGRLEALLGPSVCGACYEVPAEMRDEVDAAAAGSACRTRRGTPGLDLRAGLRRQLAALGVAKVGVDPRCTVEDPRPLQLPPRPAAPAASPPSPGSTRRADRPRTRGADVPTGARPRDSREGGRVGGGAWTRGAGSWRRELARWRPCGRIAQACAAAGRDPDRGGTDGRHEDRAGRRRRRAARPRAHPVRGEPRSQEAGAKVAEVAAPAPRRPSALALHRRPAAQQGQNRRGLGRARRVGGLRPPRRRPGPRRRARPATRAGAPARCPYCCSTASTATRRVAASPRRAAGAGRSRRRLRGAAPRGTDGRRTAAGRRARRRRSPTSTGPRDRSVRPSRRRPFCRPE